MVTNVTFFVNKILQHPIGCVDVVLPDYVKRNKAIVGLVKDHYRNATYNDNLCLFRCLALHLGREAADSVIHAHKRPSLDHTRNCQPSPNQLSNFNFLRGHHLPPIDYARPRRQQSPISTLHLALLHRPVTDLGVHVSDNMRKI